MGLHMVDQGLSPLGAFIFGTLAEIYGIRLSILISGCCAMTSVGFVLIRFPAIRSFRFGLPGEPSTAASVTRLLPEAALPARSVAD